MKKKVTRLDYCQYLLVSQINYTLTHFADHCQDFSHDAINRYLRNDKITPRMIWDNVRVGSRVIIFPEGAILYSGPETSSPS